MLVQLKELMRETGIAIPKKLNADAKPVSREALASMRRTKEELYFKVRLWKCMKPTTKINHINRVEKTNKKTNESYFVIVLLTNDGVFTNYESIWKRQMLDAESLTSVDLVEITYVTNGKYANFISVKRAGGASKKPQQQQDFDDDLLPF